MEALYLMAAIYCLIAMITFWVIYFRFLQRRDVRGRNEAFELVDIDEGFLFFLFGFFVAFFVVAVANPIRFVHIVLKAAFWPITAFMALQARGDDPSAPVTTSRSGAPRIPDSFYADVLARAGRPATPHDLFALQERLGIMFTTKAKQFMEEFGDIDDWHRFLARAGYPTSTAQMASWPQRVLDAIADWDSDAIPHLQDFPEKYSSMLLESVGTDRGFFGEDPSGPLSTANPQWHMKGMGQPDARPVLPPESVASVPSPRAPAGREPASPGPSTGSAGVPARDAVVARHVHKPMGAMAGALAMTRPPEPAPPTHRPALRPTAATATGRHAVPAPKPLAGRHARPDADTSPLSLPTPPLSLPTPPPAPAPRREPEPEAEPGPFLSPEEVVVKSAEAAANLVGTEAFFKVTRSHLGYMGVEFEKHIRPGDTIGMFSPVELVRDDKQHTAALLAFPDRLLVIWSPGVFKALQCLVVPTATMTTIEQSVQQRGAMYDDRDILEIGTRAEVFRIVFTNLFDGGRPIVPMVEAMLRGAASPRFAR